MAVTTLRLPKDLKRRIERLARAANQTSHAYMLGALAREAERSELGAQLADEPAPPEQEALSRTRSFELVAAFDYLAQRASGVKARRPKASCRIRREP
jgi:hypothetical protein